MFASSGNDFDRLPQDILQTLPGISLHTFATCKPSPASDCTHLQTADAQTTSPGASPSRTANLPKMQKALRANTWGVETVHVLPTWGDVEMSLSLTTWIWGSQAVVTAHFLQTRRSSAVPTPPTQQSLPRGSPKAPDSYNLYICRIPCKPSPSSDFTHLHPADAQNCPFNLAGHSANSPPPAPYIPSKWHHPSNHPPRVHYKGPKLHILVLKALVLRYFELTINVHFFIFVPKSIYTN